MLAVAAFWQVAAPAAPAVALAVAVGAAMVRADAAHDRRFPATVVDACSDGATCVGGRYQVPEVVAAVPVPWLSLAGLGAAAVALLLGMVAVSLTALRSATDLTELRTA